MAEPRSSILPVSKGFDLESGEEPICLEHLKLGGSDFFALGTMFPGELDDAGTSNKGYLHLIRPEQSGTTDAWTSIVVGRYEAPGCVQDVKAIWDKVAIAVDYGVSLTVLRTLDCSDLAIFRWTC